MFNFSFKTWITIGITLSIGLVLTVGIASYLSLQKLQYNQDWVVHTETVINTSNRLIKRLSDAETSQRGYAITKNKDFLILYRESLPKIEILLNHLQVLVQDNPLETKRVDSLRIITYNRLEILKEILEAYQEEKLTKNIIPRMMESKSQMDAFRALIDQIITTEQSYLLQRKADTERSVLTTNVILITGISLIFLVIVLLFRFIKSAFTAQIKTQNQLNKINRELEQLADENIQKAWILMGLRSLNEKIQGKLSISEMCTNIITNVASYSQAKVATIYLADDTGQDFTLEAGYALNITKNTKKQFKLNESWIGQVAKDKKLMIIKGDLIKNLEITTSLLFTQPIESLIIPFYLNNKIKGILEFGYDVNITLAQQEFIKLASEIIGVALNTAQSRDQLQQLYEETQLQSEELASQQEELRVTNDELVVKTQMLQSSEEELRVQQEELQEINSELHEKARLLQEKNELIEQARETVVEKMNELVQSGKYKSEFLANMSHELRTPLNSILILARILKENKSENLSEEEAKYANVIFKAGSDLLSLINDILDLTKIESGKFEFNYEEAKVKEITEDLSQLFSEVAANKQINFVISVHKNFPKVIVVDKQRIEQILKNLLANAFKFTGKSGKVELLFEPHFDNNKFQIKVIDNGIGIPFDKQKQIFEAFQQADGTTSRKYGGTGLGLSISKELAQRMDAQILLESEPNVGSTFTLIIPMKTPEDGVMQYPDEDMLKVELPTIEEDINPIKETKIEIQKRPKPLLLIVEDDIFFNHFLKEYVRKKGFEAIQIYDGESAIDKAIEHQPDAILLDIMLPGIDGWAVIKRLKSEIRTQSIPIHMMSAGDQRVQKAIHAGALSFLKKPVEKDILDKIFSDILDSDTFKYKSILLVEDQEAESEVMAKLFKSKDIEVKQAYNGAQTLAFLEEQSFDCMILDLQLPDVSGFELLERIKLDDRFKNLPIIINTAMDLEQEEINRIIKFSNATIIKSSKSSERLIDEVNLFLHKIKKPEPKKNSSQTPIKLQEEKKHKTILLVDDDMRNIFALSAILETNGYKIEIANDGLEALGKLEEVVIDLVLMDIMMPKMDGFEAMRQIRLNQAWSNLPIIALTAKAMKEDKEQCIAAGANEYVTKPIDTDKLVALVKVWLFN